MYKLIKQREKHMSAPIASTAAKTKYLIEALEKATFINIDGYMFRVTAWYEDELHFEDEESGDMHVNTLEELVEDMHEIEIYTLTKCWG